MVYGDGSDFLTNFTGCPDVIAHELTVCLPAAAPAVTSLITDGRSTP